VDVYVTGSNSKFLSSDVVTEFRGRGDEVRVHPLSFREYISAYAGDDHEAWDDYVTYGGLPLILTRDTPEDKAEYLKRLFKEVYISDIVERKRIRNRPELDELVDILASATGSLTNPLKLARTFKSVKNKPISSNTLKKYLDCLEDSFLINVVARYDVKGKRYIGSPVKYYFEDVGLRNARLNFRQTEENHIMENIIYNELRIRGFNVDVGVVELFGKEGGKTTKKQLEIDFVASLGSRKYYIQSAFSMSDPAKAASEHRPLLGVRDSFKKIIVIRDDIKPRRNEDGIVTIGIRNFLLNENSLDE
jgi:predicted AAA+ superfamily ATPase